MRRQPPTPPTPASDVTQNTDAKQKPLAKRFVDKVNSVMKSEYEEIKTMASNALQSKSSSKAKDKKKSKSRKKNAKACSERGAGESTTAAGASVSRDTANQQSSSDQVAGALTEWTNGAVSLDTLEKLKRTSTQLSEFVSTALAPIDPPQVQNSTPPHEDDDPGPTGLALIFGTII